MTRARHGVVTVVAEGDTSYDEPAARCYGEIMAARKALGRPMSMPDGQIAAIARANGGAVATHNTRDFQECGIELVDPFVAAS